MSLPCLQLSLGSHISPGMRSQPLPQPYENCTSLLEFSVNTSLFSILSAPTHSLHGFLTLRSFCLQVFTKHVLSFYSFPSAAPTRFPWVRLYYLKCLIYLLAFLLSFSPILESKVSDNRGSYLSHYCCAPSSYDIIWHNKLSEHLTE